MARSGHPLLATPLSIEEYAALDHLLVSPRGNTTGAIDRMLLDFGLSRRISLLVATYLAVPAALAASDLVATVPQRVARHIAATADMAITPLPIDFAATVSIAWHRRTVSDPAQSWFRSLLIGAAAERERDAMILATAGHIDHGKTALVRALTGVDADRLPEEKRRGLTIDLGFAYTSLPDGTELGFVDVPGHERFLPNMLAGVLSIDRVLLIVAADDGPRPQTLEHLDVLELIGVAEITGVVTKIDRVPPERLAEVETEVASLLDAAGYGGSAIFPVSSITGDGIAALAEHLSEGARHADAARAARSAERPVPPADRPGVFAARHRAGRDRYGGCRRGRGRRPAAGQPARGRGAGARHPCA